MKYWLVAAFTMIVAAVPPAAQAKAPCQNIAVQVTISPVDNFGASGPVTSAIQPDGGGPYVNGVDGVGALIQSCSGGADLTVNLQPRNKRSITLNLADMVGTPTPYTPDWASPGSAQPVPVSFFNIRNLLYRYSQFSRYSFTTRMGSQLGGLADGYHFRMVNPGDDAYTAPPDPETNYPITTSNVVVQHYAAGDGYNVETWVVYPDTTPMDPSDDPNDPKSVYVGGLITTVDRTTVSAGQYSVPFQITVQRK